MTIPESIRGPHDLKALSEAELGELSDEIRDFLVHAVARTGGHLGPNLGVVELTVAPHRVFESPADRILWDTGHQSYVHKLLTGRQDFSKLRGKGGLSGYPSREESEHDVIAVVQDNSRAAGVGSAVALALGDAEVDVPVRRFGIPEQFLAHAERAEVLADIGLTPVEIAGRMSASLTVREAAGGGRIVMPGQGEN
ncbi:1-deoxy-D-xylulose-5-phosphate synthase N-terminal domain-containing protein [Streptomyces sp. SCL15-6]|uniref:1-deoxy-D-xylulose-5-phosphate synthase N-terminal domain-containing protein n=1 Tax=Streptomyces sp. SCL15-6 TaxID=2967222 RepID=UPI0029664194|nr:1-deoxy-D-xylulose-5-phosphate synthase N-terminal domain-containing protein [Streptomyces sp. SCL15-6]